MKRTILAVALALGLSAHARAETAYLIACQEAQHPSGATVYIGTYKTRSGQVVQRESNVPHCLGQIEI